MDRYFYFDDIFEDYTKYSLKISKSLYLKSGLYPIIDQGKEEIAGYSNKNINIFDKIPVIIFGDHTRIFKYVDYPFFLGADGVKILKNTSNLFLDKYLYYSLKNFKIPNTGYNRHFKWLKDFKIKYISLIKQEKIVSLIEKIKYFILKKKEQLKYLKKLNKSLFTRMFGDIKTNDKNWEIKKLGEVVQTQYGTSKKATSIVGEFPILRMNNITYSGEMDYKDLKYIELSDSEKEKFLLKKGELLFNRTNSKELVGKTGLFNLDIPMAFAGYLIRIKPSNLIHSKFLLFFMNSEFMKKLLYNKAKNIVGMANINAKELEDFSIILPPIELQNKFAERVEKIEKLSFEIEKSIKEAENLYNSLISKYFD